MELQSQYGRRSSRGEWRYELYDVAVAEENVQAVTDTLVAAGYGVLAPLIAIEEFDGIMQRVAYLKGDPGEAALPRK